MPIIGSFDPTEYGPASTARFLKPLTGPDAETPAPEKDFFSVKDTLLALPRGVEGAAKGLWGLVDTVLPGDQMPSFWEGDNRLLGHSDTKVGGFVEPIAQFLAGFVGGSKLLGLAGKGLNALGIGAELPSATAGLTKGLQAAGVGLKSAEAAAPWLVNMGKGALTQFSFFDGHSGRLADLVNSIPALRNPITQALATDGEDPELLGRLKNSLDGILAEPLTSGVAKALGLTLGALKKGAVAAFHAGTDEATKLAAFRAASGVDADALRLSMFGDLPAPAAAAEGAPAVAYRAIEDVPGAIEGGNPVRSEPGVQGMLDYIEKYNAEREAMRAEGNLTRAELDRMKPPIAPGDVGLVSEFANRVGQTQFGDLTLKINDFGPEGRFNYLKNTVDIAASAIGKGEFQRTMLHELWHSLERNLTASQVDGLLGQFAAEKTAWAKANPAIAKAMEDGGKITVAALVRQGHPYEQALGIAREAYKYLSPSEWFAESMADRTLSQFAKEAEIASKSGFSRVWAAGKAWVSDLFGALGAKFGLDPARKAFDAFMSGAGGVRISNTGLIGRAVSDADFGRAAGATTDEVKAVYERAQQAAETAKGAKIDLRDPEDAAAVLSQFDPMLADRPLNLRGLDSPESVIATIRGIESAQAPVINEVLANSSPTDLEGIAKNASEWFKENVRGGDGFEPVMSALKGAPDQMRKLISVMYTGRRLLRQTASEFSTALEKHSAAVYDGSATDAELAVLIRMMNDAASLTVNVRRGVREVSRSLSALKAPVAEGAVEALKPGKSKPVPKSAAEIKGAEKPSVSVTPPPYEGNASELVGLPFKDALAHGEAPKGGLKAEPAAAPAGGLPFDQGGGGTLTMSPAGPKPGELPLNGELPQGVTSPEGLAAAKPAPAGPKPGELPLNGELPQGVVSAEGLQATKPGEPAGGLPFNQSGEPGALFSPVPAKPIPADELVFPPGDGGMHPVDFAPPTAPEGNLPLGQPGEGGGFAPAQPGNRLLTAAERRTEALLQQYKMTPEAASRLVQDLGGRKEVLKLMKQLLGLQQSGKLTSTLTAANQAAKSALGGPDGEAKTAGVPEFLSKATAAQRKAQLWNAFTEYWMGNLLSGPRTLVANATSNMLTSILRPLELYAGGALQALHGEGFDGIRRATDYLTGLVGSTWDALNVAKAAMGSGESVLTRYVRDSVDNIREPGITSKLLPGNVQSGPLGSITNGLGAIWRTPARILGATDEFFKQGIARAEARMALLADARAAKLGAAETVKYVNDGLQAVFDKGHALTFESVVADRYSALKEANPAMDDGALRLAARADAAEWWKKTPDRFKEVSARAVDTAEYYTFTKPLEPGSIGHSVQNLVASHPLLRLFLPFVRTPTNILGFAADRMDALGLAGAIVDRVSGGRLAGVLDTATHRAFTSQDPLVRQEVMGRLTAGVGALAGILAYTGTGAITGGGPKNKDEKAALMASGWRPYSFKIGDTYYNYSRFEPISTLIGTGADIMESLARSQPSEADHEYGDIFAALVTALTKNFTNKSFFTGLVNFADLMSNPVEEAKNVTGRIVGALAVPSLASQTTDALDTDLRQIRGYLDEIQNRVPGLSNSLEPRRDILGLPIDRKKAAGADLFGTWLNTVSPLSASEASNDPVRQEIAKLRHGFAIPRSTYAGVDLRSIRGEDGRSAYDRWMENHQNVRIGGRSLNEALAKLVASASYQKLPYYLDQGLDSPRAQEINNVLNRYRRRAFIQTTREMPALAAEDARIRALKASI